MSQLIAERGAGRDGRTARRVAGLQRFLAGWAALGVTLSGATQLRMSGLPVGPAELFLAPWMLLVLCLLLRGVRFAGTRVAVLLGGYWLGAFAVLGLGALIAVQTRRADVGAAIFNGMAYAYVGILTTFLALRLFEDNYRYHWHFARFTFQFHTLAAGVLLGLATALQQLGPIRFWYAGVRFSGWSENPNQMALAMAAMPFLGWWLIRRTSSLFGKVAYALGIATCIGAGMATLTDALRVAWLASFGVIGGLLFYRATMRGRSRWFYLSHVMLPALVVIVGVSFGDDVIEYLFGAAERVYAEGEQGEKRFTLWFHGIEAIGASPLFGLGPGPFSGYGGPFEGNEAHNSFIDWGMSTGLTGILMYCGLLVWVAWSALRSGETTLVGMWVSVVTVSIFGYVLRQPDFWAVLVLVLILSESAIAARNRSAGLHSMMSGNGGRSLRSARQIERISTP